MYIVSFTRPFVNNKIVLIIYILFISIFNLKQKSRNVGPTLVIFGKSKKLKHHIHNHHNDETDHSAPSAKVRVPVRLRVGDKVLDYDENHSARSERK